MAQTVIGFFSTAYLQLFLNLPKYITPLLQTLSQNYNQNFYFFNIETYLHKFFLNKFSEISVFRFPMKSKG